MKDKLTPKEIVKIINNLYDKGLAQAWFYGLAWPEGYVYCANPLYLENFAKGFENVKLLDNNYKTYMAIYWAQNL